MEIKPPIFFGIYYHIFNRGNNNEIIFFEKENYVYFLKLYKKYIGPIPDTYAWCLMNNHFHFLVRIKEESEIDINKLNYTSKTSKLEPSRQFSHLFNAYTQAINKRHKRTGSLFEKPFERKQITDEAYFKKLIQYINTNPVRHGIVEKVKEYPWSSYLTVISEKPTNLMRKEVIEMFGDLNNFVYCHNQIPDLD